MGCYTEDMASLPISCLPQIIQPYYQSDSDQGAEKYVDAADWGSRQGSHLVTKHKGDNL
jgi:hypothetical protein